MATKKRKPKYPKAIRAIRAALQHETTRCLAQRAKVSQTTISLVSRNMHPASELTQKRINRVLGTTARDWA